MPYVGEFSITFLNCSTVILASSAASSTDRRPFLTSSISVLILPSLKLSSLMPWLRLHIISTSFLKLLYLPQLGLKIRAQSDTSSRTVRVQGSSLPFSVTGIFRPKKHFGLTDASFFYQTFIPSVSANSLSLISSMMISHLFDNDFFRFWVFNQHILSLLFTFFRVHLICGLLLLFSEFFHSFAIVFC